MDYVAAKRRACHRALRALAVLYSLLFYAALALVLVQ